MFKLTHLIICVIFVCDISLQQEYVIPEATIELLYPKGFSVSIPDEQGIILFAFHGKLNEQLSGREGGTYSRDITKAKNGKWTFIDKGTRFQIGDKIYYWLYVDYLDGKNQLGYTSDFREYTVTACPNGQVDSKGVCNGRDENEFEVPDAFIEILQPRGFKVSIPDRDGIQLFAFHGKINEEFNGREAGQFARDITYPTNGRWTFIDKVTKFNPGDVLYYWLYVTFRPSGGNDLGYIKEDQKYTIPDSHNAPCDKSATIWNGVPACSGQVLLDENFVSLNSSTWRKEIRFADEPDYEFVIYEEFDENLNIENGQLRIKPSLADDKFGEGFIYLRRGYDLGNRCTSNMPYNCKRTLVGGYPLPPVFSAQISTVAYFKYGRVDVRAKLPKGDWIYPEFFLSPRLYEYGKKDYDSGQIRFGFCGGNDNLNNEIQSMILLGTSVYGRSFHKKTLTKTEKWSDDYHIYSVIWKPDSITFLVDEVKYGEIVPPPGGFSELFAKEKPSVAKKWASAGKMAPFDKEMILQIGVGVGGHSFPDSISGKPYTNEEPKPHAKFYNERFVWKRTWNQNELIVDYIRINAL